MKAMAASYDWLKVSRQNFVSRLWIVLPVALSQILQRLFHVVDNRFVGLLGNDALLLHNVQYTFVVFGQLMGAATATSALVFWSRKETEHAKRSLLNRHLMTSAGLGIFFWALFASLAQPIFSHFSVAPALYAQGGHLYFLIGLTNMALQGVYGTIDGCLIASGKQKVTFVLSAIQVTLNAISDYAAVSYFHSTGRLDIALVIVGVSTSFILLIALVCGYAVARKQATGSETVAVKMIFPVLRAEVMVGLLRACVPLVAAWIFARIEGSANFLVTHNLALHLSYLFCLPLLASAQVAVKDASADYLAPDWKSGLFYTGILPTTALLIMAAIIGGPLIGWAYGFQVPKDHLPYLTLFFVACAVGQIANALAVPLRAQKKSFLITRHFAISEYGVWLGGMALLVLSHRATPSTIGLATILFAGTFLTLNLHSVLRLKERK